MKRQTFVARAETGGVFGAAEKTEGRKAEGAKGEGSRLAWFSTEEETEERTGGGSEDTKGR
jgi:hypothetical protein